MDLFVEVERDLERALEGLAPASRALGGQETLRTGTTLTAAQALELFADQVTSRALDAAAQHLRAAGRGYYTIASAGHEQNVVAGAILRPTDPAFLHYRSGAFMVARSRHDRAVDPVADTVRSLMAAADDPIAQGRHKVWGSRPLWVPPQTSTIGSHLPKAVGTAFSIGRARRLGLSLEIPADSVVYCSFGDASVNHATALAAVNAARYAHRRGSAMPILFVCEDNGWGISVDTPPGWVAETFGDQPHLRYVRAGGDVGEVWDRMAQAVSDCRQGQRPVFCHLDVVRLGGHAGSDVETSYRREADVQAAAAHDPLRVNARALVDTGAATPAELRALVHGITAGVSARTEELAGARVLATREEVTAPLALRAGPPARREAARGPADSDRRRMRRRLPEDEASPVRRTLAAHLNAALHDELAHRPELLVFGQDVGRKGGVYHVTAGLQDAFGASRVFDTLLDETTILGLAQGAGLLGLLPVPEIQYLAYVHNALDQLRGEACSTQFFSSGQFATPMVVRIAGLAYQRGFGGHFHNDNSLAALRDIPGLVLAVPARGDDAAKVLRGAIGLAKAEGKVVCLVEPIALYHERDLYEQGDGGWLTDYPPPGQTLLPGEVGVYHPENRDLLIVSYGNGLRLSLRACRQLATDHGLHARVLDLRWLNPLPRAAVRAHAAACGAVLVVDECRATGGVADELLADLATTADHGDLRAVQAADSYVPLGPAATTVLVTEEAIVAGARRAVGVQAL